MTTASTSLTWYLNQAGRYPLLTPSQELTLGRQVREWQDHVNAGSDPPPNVIRRGQRARDRFVRANLRLVVTIAGRYRSVPSQYSDDLIQAGNLGLIRAVERFDPARGYKFSTYAYWWIRQAINTWVETYTRTIRLPSNHPSQWGKLIEARQRLDLLLGRSPSLEELAEALGWSIEMVSLVLSRPAATASLDTTCRPDLDDCPNLIDSISAGSLDPLEALHDAHQVERINELLTSLTPNERLILEELYLSPAPLTLNQIARRHGLTRDRARSIERLALFRLRQLIHGTSAPPPPVQECTYGAQLTLFAA